MRSNNNLSQIGLCRICFRWLLETLQVSVSGLLAVVHRHGTWVFSLSRPVGLLEDSRPRCVEILKKFWPSPKSIGTQLTGDEFCRDCRSFRDVWLLKACISSGFMSLSGRKRISFVASILLQGVTNSVPQIDTFRFYERQRVDRQMHDA